MADTLHIHIEKHFGEFSLTFTEDIVLRGTTVLFGASGSGKSTLLRLISGFETPDSGEITFNQTVWTRPKYARAPNTRPVGYMGQNATLFPHLTVQGNLDYSERRNPTKDGAPNLSRSALIEALDLKPLLDRDVTTLSGGERQRVALARTLLRRPKFLLLDEPLAALDRGRKREILPFLHRLPKDFGIPCLYVSHDLEEVSQLADHVIVLDHGRVQKRGDGLDILGQIESQDRAHAASVLEMKATKFNHEKGLTTFSLGDIRLDLPVEVSVSDSRTRRIRIAAKDVAIALSRPQDLSIRNSLSATIVSIERDAQSPFALIALSLTTLAPSAPPLLARITRASAEDLDLQPGQSVFALVKSVSFAMNLV